MVEYLVGTSYELWMIKYMLHFVVLMTITAEIDVEKSSKVVYVYGNRSHLKSKLLTLS